jgi:hypothetical protein
MRAIEFVDLILTNPINAAILERLPRTGLPDGWLVSGALFRPSGIG